MIAAAEAASAHAHGRTPSARNRRTPYMHGQPRNEPRAGPARYWKVGATPRWRSLSSVPKTSYARAPTSRLKMNDQLSPLVAHGDHDRLCISGLAEALQRLCSAAVLSGGRFPTRSQKLQEGRRSVAHDRRDKTPHILPRRWRLLRCYYVVERGAAGRVRLSPKHPLGRLPPFFE